MRKESRMVKQRFSALAVFLAIAMAPLVGYPEILPKAVVKFTGQEIRDSQRTGLIAFPAKGMPFLTVGSLYHDYTLLLPYSESWELESGAEVPLFARDKHYIASVMIGISPITTPTAYYDEFLENMKKSGEYETRNVETIKGPNMGRQLLRYQARKARLPEEFQHMNKWLWNYWMAVLHDSRWYALHASVLDDNDESLRREERKVLFAVDSFSPGTFNKKRAGEPSTSTHKGNVFQYKNPQNGELHFMVPESWKSTHEKSFEKQTDTITFTSQSGNSFKLMIDLLVDRKNDSQTQDTIKQQGEQFGNRLLSNAKEKQLKVIELKGNYSPGYYYTLTDRAPKPGEWEYITQGRIGAGGYLLHFTIFTNSRDAKEINEALTMLGSVKYVQK